jgi:hypothetical protein
MNFLKKKPNASEAEKALNMDLPKLLEEHLLLLLSDEKSQDY